MFSFDVGSLTDYGWLELSVNGLNVDVLGYAYDNTGKLIKAGAVPEPQHLPLALGALAFGAIGIRELRKEAHRRCLMRLLFVGWDAADWKVIDPLLARGEMPNLAALLRQGVRANSATIHPPLSPMVWTSIATGKRPAKHGIHGFTEPTEDGYRAPSDEPDKLPGVGVG